MKISEILKNEDITISMEVFPPKSNANYDDVEAAVKEIAKLKPSFISCTYGAGGGTSDNTVKISKTIKDLGVTSMAHLTCISSTKDKVESQIKKIKENNIENILALRGDIPKDMEFPMDNHFRYASDLINEIKTIYPEACIGGACYPEKHPEALNKDADIKNIKKKVDAGCEFLTTQMFFDNSVYYNYLYRLREAGINVPVIAGIMPVTSKRQMERSIELSGCIVPPRFKALVDKFGDNPEAMTNAGIVYACDQIIDLLANGIKNIHIYTMNKPDVSREIYTILRGII
ncbi:5,10-methylenetetrahydrofolate reductase (NAD(P)) [Lachnospiraceae bacterium RM5]|nr:5,10-methylenetetrahydrofolate reductase (NAD(P)) [Lachnospiraceae bacterium RM5]